MLTNEQIDTIHRLHFVEKWTVRQIARHLHIGRRTVAKYLVRPAQAPPHPNRGSKLDRFKPTIEEWLGQDSSIPAAVILQRLRELGFTGGYTILKDHLQQVRAEKKQRRAFVRDGTGGWRALRDRLGPLRCPLSTMVRHASSMPSL